MLKNAFQNGKIFDDKITSKRLVIHRAARNFVKQPKDFSQQVLWSNEKYFVLHQAPNMQNDVTWAPWHPEEEVEFRRQGDSKVMCWCGMVDRKMLQVRWMIGEDGRPASVT